MAQVEYSGQTNFGRVRHNASQEPLFFSLALAGNPVSSKTIGSGAGKVSVTIVLPDETTYDIHSGSPPSNTVTEVVASSGFYRLRLWGSGQSSPVNKPLLQAGRYGIYIFSSAAEFDPVLGYYEVVPAFDIKFANIYVTGSASTATITGSLTFSHWEVADLITAPQSNLSAISVTIRDDSTTLLTMTNLATDFTQNNDSLFFSKTVSGVAGGKVLVARVSATYAGVVAKRDFLIPVRY